MVKADGMESLSDIDEALLLLSEQLKIDVPGNRMTYQKRFKLMLNIDSMLDARLEKIEREKALGTAYLESHTKSR